MIQAVMGVTETFFGRVYTSNGMFCPNSRVQPGPYVLPFGALIPLDHEIDETFVNNYYQNVMSEPAPMSAERSEPNEREEIACELADSKIHDVKTWNWAAQHNRPEMANDWETALLWVWDKQDQKTRPLSRDEQHAFRLRVQDEWRHNLSICRRTSMEAVRDLITKASADERAVIITDLEALLQHARRIDAGVNANYLMSDFDPERLALRTNEFNSLIL